MIREFLFDVAKIVEGATNDDPEKVLAYSRQLGERLDAAGEKEAAKRIRQIISRSSAGKLVAARAMGDNAPNDVPVDSESRMPIADEEFLSAEDEKVVLPQSAKSQVDQFLAFFRAADRLVANGVGVSPTMLIYGPPGCGKTKLARHIAAELKMPLITARTDGLISSYLGSTAKNIRLLFEHAASRPCVLFLDEFDAVAKMRDDGRELGELKRVVISLLQNIDAIGKDHVLIAATNHEHLLDPAIWRRFSFSLHIPLPDRDARIVMLQQFLRAFGSESLIDVLSALTDGMSGGQIREIADNAVRAAVLDNESEIGLKQAVNSVLSSRPDLRQADSLDERVRAVREVDPKVFTQKRLAELFDICQSNVSYILRGKRSNGRCKISPDSSLRTA
jgi:SpoVK/Ycf46/Vps4 family AAA+-type ATPase